MNNEQQLVIFEGEAGQVEVRLEGETVWLSQAQMAELFDKDVRTVNEHIQNVYQEGELEQEATIRKFRIVRQEGQRQVQRDIAHYNLDVIISVGYRVKSQQGIFLWLQRYDEGLLTEPLGSPGGLLPSTDEARTGVGRLKADLMAREEATGLFGNEREGSLAATLALLVTESDPKTKEVMSRLIENMLAPSQNEPVRAMGNKAVLRAERAAVAS